MSPRTPAAMARHLLGLRKQREAWRRAGLCYTCGAAPAEKHKLCEEHLAYHRRRKREVRAERLATGTCIYCDEVATCGQVCATHRRKAREAAQRNRDRKDKRRARRAADVPRKRAWYASRTARGLCQNCGEPARPGRVRCDDCHATTIERCAELRMERRLAGLCECGRRPDNGFATCRRCRKIRARRVAHRYAKRRAAGLCARCGVEWTGGDVCGGCRAKLAAAQARRKRRAFAVRVGRPPLRRAA